MDVAACQNLETVGLIECYCFHQLYAGWRVDSIVGKVYGGYDYLIVNELALTFTLLLTAKKLQVLLIFVRNSSMKN